MVQNLKKKIKKSKIAKKNCIPEARSAELGNNNRFAVVVCARHVVKRPSKRSALVYIYTLSGQKYFNTFKLCHMAEICMPLKLFVLKITSNVLIYPIIG